MRKIQNVADEFVVHVESVEEVRGFEIRVREFLPHFGFDPAERILNRLAPQVVADKKQVRAAVIVLDENSGNNNELEFAGLLEFLNDIFGFDRIG